MSPEVEVQGHTLRLSNLEKVYYPRTGFTKGEVIDYYARIAPVLLPHLRDRPLTLKRYPDGVEGEFFYQKACPTPRPSWFHTVAMKGDRGGDSKEYCTANDLAALLWLANLGDIEIHPFLAREPHLDRPDFVAFDLDPGPGTGIAECARVALDIRDHLSPLELEGFPKTSGGKGMQLYVPLHTRVTYDQTRPFSHAVAAALEREHPARVTSNMAKAQRRGRVFVDWSQNTRHKTTVSVYSLRARPEPRASTPVTWTEVETAAQGHADLVFSPADVLQRVEEKGDLFEPVLRLRQPLPKEFTARAGSGRRRG